MGESRTVRCLCYQIVITSEFGPLILVINIDHWILAIRYLCYQIILFYFFKYEWQYFIDDKERTSTKQIDYSLED